MCSSCLAEACIICCCSSIMLAIDFESASKCSSSLAVFSLYFEIFFFIFSTSVLRCSFLFMAASSSLSLSLSRVSIYLPNSSFAVSSDSDSVVSFSQLSSLAFISSTAFCISERSLLIFLSASISALFASSRNFSTSAFREDTILCEEESIVKVVPASSTEAVLITDDLMYEFPPLAILPLSGVVSLADLGKEATIELVSSRSSLVFPELLKKLSLVFCWAAAASCKRRTASLVFGMEVKLFKSVGCDSIALLVLLGWVPLFPTLPIAEYDCMLRE
mmetsp:Transcript_14129/g.17858  ORF Transcript_14129/g.17858 Transcript_14129/m.17858 type:complete len:276 (-) Transcript_14129:558-1385(-)